MKKVLPAAGIFLMLAVTVPATQKEPPRPWSSYTEAEGICTTLYYEKKYAQAIRLLKLALQDFPGQYDEIIWSLAVNYSLNSQPGKALAALEQAQSRKVIFPDPSFYNYWKSLEKFPRFKAIRERNNRMIKEARRTARPQWKVITPKDFRTDDNYPLIIALHGWAGSIRWLEMYWKSSLLTEKFLVAFMQSSQLVKTNGYCWDNPDLARREIAAMYREITSQYPVDEKRVYVGGFSQGGKTALDLSFSDEIPIRGFVVLCPGGGIPEILKDPTALKRAKRKGLRGVILTGDKDGSLAQQQEIVKILKSAGIPHRFRVFPNLYHWFPPDFPTHLDKSLLIIQTENR